MGPLTVIGPLPVCPPTPECRRVATRYDKLAANYLAFIKLAYLHLAARQ
jgi:hypothetical protein